MTGFTPGREASDARRFTASAFPNARRTQCPSLRSSGPPSKTQPVKNECNGCTACCIQFTIPELKKPARTPCIHLCEAGCSIYDQLRYPICSKYECGYLLLEWPIELRPDRCEIILHLEAAAKVNPRSGLVTLKPGTLAEMGDRPKLWTGNCITAEVFANPPEVVQSFIHRQVKKKGAVVLTYVKNGPTSTRIFAHESLGLTSARYWDFFQQTYSEQFRANQEFNRSQRISRDLKNGLTYE